MLSFTPTSTVFSLSDTLFCVIVGALYFFAAALVAAVQLIRLSRSVCSSARARSLSVADREQKKVLCLLQHACVLVAALVRTTTLLAESAPRDWAVSVINFPTSLIAIMITLPLIIIFAANMLVVVLWRQVAVYPFRPPLLFSIPFFILLFCLICVLVLLLFFALSSSFLSNSDLLVQICAFTVSALILITSFSLYYYGVLLARSMDDADRQVRPRAPRTPRTPESANASASASASASSSRNVMTKLSQILKPRTTSEEDAMDESRGSPTSSTTSSPSLSPRVSSSSPSSSSSPPLPPPPPSSLSRCVPSRSTPRRIFFVALTLAALYVASAAVQVAAAMNIDTFQEEINVYYKVSYVLDLSILWVLLFLFSYGVSNSNSSSSSNSWSCLSCFCHCCIDADSRTHSSLSRRRTTHVRDTRSRASASSPVPVDGDEPGDRLTHSPVSEHVVRREAAGSQYSYEYVPPSIRQQGTEQAPTTLTTVSTPSVSVIDIRDGASGV